MKNLALALLLSVLVAACSSGNTISDVPQNVTSTFQGSFTDSVGSGSITLNLSDDNAGNVSGSILVGGSTCLQSASFSGGVSNGFNLTIGIPQSLPAGPGEPDTFMVVTTTTTPDVTNADGTTTPGSVTITTEILPTGIVGMEQQTLADGTTIEVVTTLIAGEEGMETMGTLTFQLAITNGGSVLSGTFISEGDVCPPGEGSAIPP